jgi:hypothetical protein
VPVAWAMNFNYASTGSTNLSSPPNYCSFFRHTLHLTGWGTGFQYVQHKARDLFIAFTTLLLELTLIRIFDHLWFTNMAYMIITLAMFSIGVSGVLVSLRPADVIGTSGLSCRFLL